MSLLLSCATANVLRSPEECFMQLPILYFKFKDKVFKLDDDVVMKQRIGTLFSNYPLKLAKETSQKERTERALYDEEYCYGEMDIEQFNKMFQRIKRIFGHMPKDQNGVFWDLGCGCGKLVLCAGAMHQFTQCWGIDYLRSLTDLGQDMLKEWNQMESFTSQRDYFKDIQFRIVCANLLESDAYVDNTTVCFIHSTCFSDEMMDTIAQKSRGMNVGTLMITVTKPLPDEKLWYTIGTDLIEMTWGKAKFFFQEKIAIG